MNFKRENGRLYIEVPCRACNLLFFTIKRWEGIPENTICAACRKKNAQH